MKVKSEDGKFTVEIKDGYLRGGKYHRKDRVAFIRLSTESSSVTLKELSEVIFQCTNSGIDEMCTIDANRFDNLKVFLEVKRTGSLCSKYTFDIPVTFFEEDILFALAESITI